MNLLKKLSNKTFNFQKFFEDFTKFYDNDYPKLVQYWQKMNTFIDPDVIKRFRKLQTDYDLASQTFKTITRSRTIDLDYFDMAEALADIKNCLDGIVILPRYMKTSLNNVDIFEKPVVEYTVVQGDTLESIAKRFYGDSEKFQEVMDCNNIAYTDVNSSDWVGSVIKIPVVKKANMNLDGIIDGLVGENILGKDVSYEIVIENDDFKTVQGEDCFLQSINNLIEDIPVGTIPEDLSLGNSTGDIIGRSLGGLSVPMITNEVKRVLKSDPTVELVEVSGVESVDDSIHVSFICKSVLGTESKIVKEVG